MKHKKIASLVAIAILWIGIPFFSIPRAAAFHDNISFALTGVQTYSDPLFGTVSTARENAPVTLTVLIDSADFTGQENITVGIWFSWMTSYVNASNADTDSTLIVTKNQFVTVTASVTLPPLSGGSASYNLYEHTWIARVWRGAANAPSTNIVTSSSGSFAIYNAAQADGMAARADATEKINALETLLAPLIGLTEPLPGKAKAVGDLSQAQAELALGDDFYTTRDFAAANTHYRNALNLANSAAGALSGAESGTYFGDWFAGVGWLLIGVAAFLGGFGSFFYLRKRAKS